MITYSGYVQTVHFVNQETGVFRVDSQAEGCCTICLGSYSHAEGRDTLARAIIHILEVKIPYL